MADEALYRLLAWLSPSYPVGAFAYSHGIEWAVEEGTIRDAETLEAWIRDVLEIGGGWSDAVLLRHAHESAGDRDTLGELNDLAVALSPSKERHLETTAQGNAFLRITCDAWPWPGCEEDLARLPDAAYPVAVGLAATRHKISLVPVLHAYLHGVAANLVSAGVRLIPLGQTDGQKIVAALEGTIADVTQRAATAKLDQLGGAAFLSDIASMKHETQYTRLFRS